jgi:hypothetical protein
VPAGESDDPGRLAFTLKTGVNKRSHPAGLPRRTPLPHLSTGSVYRVSDRAAHASLITDRHDAAATVRGILDVVAAVPTAIPLAP